MYTVIVSLIVVEIGDSVNYCDEKNYNFLNFVRGWVLGAVVLVDGAMLFRECLCKKI